MANRVCPCKDCEKRELYCHSSCKDYLLWSKAREAIRDTIYKKKVLEGEYIDYRKTEKIKAKRKGNRN